MQLVFIMITKRMLKIYTERLRLTDQFQCTPISISSPESCPPTLRSSKWKHFSLFVIFSMSTVIYVVTCGTRTLFRLWESKLNLVHFLVDAVFGQAVLAICTLSIWMIRSRRDHAKMFNGLIKLDSEFKSMK